MRACMELENAAAVLAAYGQLWRSLEKDYDIEPSVATRELAVAIKHGTHTALTASRLQSVGHGYHAFDEPIRQLSGGHAERWLIR